MQSPFPGMDPFIEACGLWEDCHNHLIEKIAERLAETVPERYHIRTGERSYVVLVGAESKSDEFRETFVEIYESGLEQRLVTCIEALSPSNKRPGSKGWKRYLRKRRSLLVGKVNLVEIDLLRAGERMPMLDAWPDSPYTLLVHRGTGTELCRVWPAHYRQPLPSLPVPLAKPDDDIRLEIQPMIEAIYARHRYEASIDYRKPLTPPLPREDAAWLKQHLKGRRSRS